MMLSSTKQQDRPNVHQWIEQLLSFASAHPQLLGLIVCFAAAAEAIVVVGAFVPGTAIILGISGIAGATSLSLWPLVLWATLGAAIGDGASYWIGRYYGGALAGRWPFSSRPQILKKGSAFFDRHGGKSVFFGRFVPGIKAVVPAIAGMLKMPVPGFLAANLSSGLIWAAIHVLPAAAAGVLVATIGAVSGRLVAALVGTIVAILVAFWLAQVLVIRAAPWVALGYRKAVSLLSRSDHYLARRFARVLDPGNPHLLGAVGWSALFLLAAIGLIAVVEDIVTADPLVRADASISHFVQSLRTPPFDRLMVRVTEFGDSIVVGVTVVALLAALVLARRWRPALAVASAFALASAAVPLIKLALHRQRPMELYSGAELFSFPSGHSTFSALLLATMAMLIAQRLRVRDQIAIWTAALLGIVAIGTSRIYLGAHWPSDVFGGILVGTLISCLLALILAFKARAGRAGVWSGITATAVFLSFGTVHGELVAPRDLARYASSSTRASMSEAAWLAEGWRQLPQRRIDLLGETEEPFSLQYLGPTQEIANRLVKDGWQRAPAANSTVFLRLMSATTTLASVPPLPLLHDGAWPVLTMASAAEDTSQRLVFRLWPSAHLIGAGKTDQKLWLGSVTVETIVHPYGALSVLRDEPAPPTRAIEATTFLSSSPAFTPAQRSSANGTEVLLLKARD
jgi:membrane protein DedA with SNARE-associated domain/membrane-associated phospholipid phosphatase